MASVINKGHMSNTSADVYDYNLKDSIFLKPTTEFEILEIISKMNSQKSSGVDHI